MALIAEMLAADLAAAAILQALEEEKITRLAKINEVKSDGTKINKWNEDICSTCVDAIENLQLTQLLPCEHLYHSACIAEWLTIKIRENSQIIKCPMCSANIDNIKLISDTNMDDALLTRTEYMNFLVPFSVDRALQAALERARERAREIEDAEYKLRIIQACRNLFIPICLAMNTRIISSLITEGRLPNVEETFVLITMNLFNAPIIGFANYVFANDLDDLHRDGGKSRKSKKSKKPKKTRKRRKVRKH
jgi:hypothetical protein